jgi:hemerythrin superfamily protein
MSSTHQSEIRTGEDVVTFLKQQHEQIKALFEKVLASHGDERKDAFVALRRLLAVHETAEEQIVHPRAKAVLDEGKSVVADRLDEENEAKKVLAELEDLDLESGEFETAFTKFQADVVRHASAEEELEFAELKDILRPDELERMRDAARTAETIAPTRPHAGVESRTANMLAGPFASMLDRARDLLTGKAKDA